MLRAAHTLISYHTAEVEKLNFQFIPDELD